MNEPRPAMISARPPDRRSSVAKSWKTRTGSSELSTVTALVSRMRLVPAPGAGGRRNDRRGRDHEGLAVVLAHAEHVEPDLVGELDLLDEVPQALLRRDQLPAGRVGGPLPEAVDAELDVALPGGPRPAGRRA